MSYDYWLIVGPMIFCLARIIWLVLMRLATCRLHRIGHAQDRHDVANYLS